MTTDEAKEVRSRVPLSNGPALEEKIGSPAGTGAVPSASQAEASDVLRHYAAFRARRRARLTRSVAAQRHVYPDDDDARAI